MLRYSTPRWDKGDGRYDFTVTFKEAGAWWEFTACVPRFNPLEIRVKGCTSNPGYTSDIPLQRRKREAVRCMVEDAVEEALKEESDGTD
jgi:hypothetical protein